MYLITNRLSTLYRAGANLTDKDESLSIDGKGGQKCRILNPGHRRFKVIQKRIHRNILRNLQLGNRYRFTTDLRNFFPSIDHCRVF
jgi:RNA-directed DNA polymerase